MSALIERLRPLMIGLLAEGGGDNRLVMQGDRGYMVVEGEQGGDRYTVQAAVGRAISRELDPSDAQNLYSQGFRRPTAASLYKRSYGSDELDTLLKISEQAMSQIYLSQPEDPNLLQLNLKLGDRDDLSNERLLRAIEKLSKVRNMSARQKLYWAFVKATLLLAVDSDVPEFEGIPRRALIGRINYMSFKEITSYHSVGVFTDEESAMKYDPRGLRVYKISGRDLAALCVADKVDSILINPRGHIGGELYRNEILSIDEAMQNYDEKG